WSDSVCSVPNVCLRSALFGAIRKGRRRYLSGEKIAAIEGVEIHYKGERLDQGDLDVYEAVLHLLRDQPLGKECHTTSYALLKLMGKNDTGGNRGVLKNRIERLCATAVTIKTASFTYIGSFVNEAYKDERTHEWVIVLNPKLKALFTPDQYTQIQWAIRRDLEGHQLAQWLHGFYASHAKPYPIKIETLHRLCGSEAILMNDFAKKLRKALDAITEACAKHGEQFIYEICGDLVHVTKQSQGASQRGYRTKLARKP
ncbi:MAG: hypothetical protein JJ714_10455, partial [Acidithiobacillus sp.]|nr:hypothetical protein [Acidithiobacillus sp.]